MKKQKRLTAKTINVSPEVHAEYFKMKAKWGMKFSAHGFMMDVFSVYDKAHCPECGGIPRMRCACKDGDML